MEFLSKSPEETKEIAFNFAQSLQCNEEEATVLGLYGELGSGKTTFMKYFAEFFGVKETIHSPTFVIMKIYKTSLQPLSLSRRGATRSEGGEVFEHLIHIDAYRIDEDHEMINLGWNEMVSDPKNLICIEWPERIKNILPPHAKIFFEHAGGENERKIKIEVENKNG